MNLSHLPRHHIPNSDSRPGLGMPKIPILANISLSTKLILLVVIPLALTLVVTLLLAVTGLNRLASMTSTERLQDEILLVDKHFELLEKEIERAADDIAQDPAFLAMVRGSDQLGTRSIVLSSLVNLGLQHLEVFDRNGVSFGHEHHSTMEPGSNTLMELNAIEVGEIETTKLLQTPNGWFFVSLRSLNDSEGYLGRIVAGKLVDFDALTELNSGRSDPVLTSLGEVDQLIATSFKPNVNNMESPITPDPEYVGVARRGQTVVASVLVDGKNVRTAYAPVGFGSGSRGLFAVSLTKTLGVSIRNQLIADHVIVVAALSLLVLGLGYMVTWTITKRILRLRDGAVEIGNGNLSFRIEENTNDEMGTLAREFNLMSDRLKDKTDRLEQANQDPERRVLERTGELQQANVQLMEAQAELVRTEKFGALGLRSWVLPRR